MPSFLSPGFNFTEIDLTTTAPVVGAASAGIAAPFRWGPIGQLVLVNTESTLATRFGTPTNYNAENWFSAASFLAYANALYVSRAAETTDHLGTTGVLTAVANVGSYDTANSSIVLGSLVKNNDDYEAKDGNFDASVMYMAKYPGALGNSLKVSVCDSATAYESTIDLTNVDGTLEADAAANAADNPATMLSIAVGSNTANVILANSASHSIGNTLPLAVTVANRITVGDLIQVGTQRLKVATVTTPAAGTPTGTAFFNITFTAPMTQSANVETTVIDRKWEFSSVIGNAPGTSTTVEGIGGTAVDELHVVVVDEDGKFTGAPGGVLEVYEALSRSTDAQNEDGSIAYYKDVLNQGSEYVWFGNDRANAASAPAASVATSTNIVPLTLSFINGSDGSNESAVSISALATAADLFKSVEDVDIALLVSGKARGGTNGEQWINYLIDNVSEYRQDVVACGSPEYADVVNNKGNEVTDILAWASGVRSSSYAFLDSGYKYMYDRYNDVYRYVPLNGDTAGLMARIATTRDAWWSPAISDNSQIRNVIKVAFNPDKTARDALYPKRVNAVVSSSGQGTRLYGDKTALAKPSAFAFINVRRLFIVLRKAIAEAAKDTLFQFNDEFTRAQFVGQVDPFLLDVQGRRGIYGYEVICDETNNTGEVIDRGEFVGTIKVKPSRTIQGVQLNFVATKTGVEFSEVVI